MVGHPKFVCRLKLTIGIIHFTIKHTTNGFPFLHQSQHLLDQVDLLNFNAIYLGNRCAALHCTITFQMFHTLLWSTGTRSWMCMKPMVILLFNEMVDFRYGQIVAKHTITRYFTLSHIYTYLAIHVKINANAKLDWCALQAQQTNWDVVVSEFC